MANGIQNPESRILKAARLAAMAVVCVGAMAGCSSTLKAPAASKAAPPVVAAPSVPTANGVRTLPNGSAVAEVEMAPEVMFGLMEEFLRQRDTISFINRSIWKIETKAKRRASTVSLNDLTTGKTGLTVVVMNTEEKRADPEGARRLADEIIEAIRSAPRSKPVVPLKSSSTAEPAEPAK